MKLEKIRKRERRHYRVRAKVFGTAKRPRLSIYKSLKHIYAQIINDEKGETLVATSDLELKKSKVKSQKSKLQVKSKKLKEEKEKKVQAGKVAIAYEVGKLIAQKALKKKIKRVVFDRGGFKYHGRIKALTEGVRTGGLEF